MIINKINKNLHAKIAYKLLPEASTIKWKDINRISNYHPRQYKMSTTPHNIPIENVCVFGTKSKRICDNTDPSQEGYCVKCFDRTFAACEKATEWSVCNEKPAHQYMRSGRGSAWFTCATCIHDYSVLFTYARKPGRGAPCPFCSGKRVNIPI